MTGDPATSAAVIPYRIQQGEVEILLVTTKGGKRWIAPKGHLEPGEDPRRGAEREALEEAGVEGWVSMIPLGTYRQRRRGKSAVVEVYLMRVDREYEVWPERRSRKRRWVPVAEAYAALPKELRPLLDSAEARLAPRFRGYWDLGEL